MGGLFFTSNSMKAKIPNRKILYTEYEKLFPARTLAVSELEKSIEIALKSLPSKPRVNGRLKSFDSYFKKLIRHHKPRRDTSRINDLIGIRIVCHFLEDLSAVEDLLKKHFNVIEVERKGGDHTYREFGYESIHLMITIPEEILKKFDIPGEETAEVQIRTILQDAWAEVEHELIYKAEFTPFDDPLRRKLAAINASLSLADIIFQEIRSYQQELNGELGKRRFTFFKKIEESTDAVFFPGERVNIPEESNLNDSMELFAETMEEESRVDHDSSNDSIDDLLLKALSAHNRNNLQEAIAVYTHILEMDPSDEIKSLIFQHRGMAHFARSHYEEAIHDFAETQKLDKKSYKASYYEGIVCSVLTRYSGALEAFNRSLEVNPYQPYCLFRRAQVFFHLEDYPHALSDCEAALSLENFEAALKFKELVMSKLKM